MKRHMAQPFRFNAKRIRIIHQLKALLIQTGVTDQSLMLRVIDPQIAFHKIIQNTDGYDAKYIRKRIVQNPIGIINRLPLPVKDNFDRIRLIEHPLTDSPNQSLHRQTHRIFRFSHILLIRILPATLPSPALMIPYS